jgi:hypothetical protein
MLQLSLIKSAVRAAAQREIRHAGGNPATMAIAASNSLPPHARSRMASSRVRPQVAPDGIIYASSFADPTGATDASAGLQRAIEALLAGTGNETQLWGGAVDLSGRALELDGGQYVLSRPLHIPAGYANFEIRGGTLRAGPGFPSSLPDGKPAFLLTLGNLSAHKYIESVSLSTMLLQGAGIAHGGLNLILGVGVDIGPSIYVQGFLGAGIQVDQGAEAMIHDCW